MFRSARLSVDSREGAHSPSSLQGASISTVRTIALEWLSVVKGKKLPEEHLMKEVARCVRCGACRAVCPSFIYGDGESFSPRGRIAIIKATLEGRLPFSEIYRDRLATCLGCLSCDVICPAGVPASGIIRTARERAFAEEGPRIAERLVAGVFKYRAAMRSLAWLAPFVLRFRPDAVSGFGGAYISTFPHKSVKAGASKGTDRAVFFPGCGLQHLQQDVLSASIEVLSAIGYDVYVPEKGVCCGQPLLSLGDRSGAEKFGRMNAKIFADLGADTVITACATCGLTFKKEYPKLLPPGVRIPRVMDIHEALVNRLPRDLKIDPIHVTVHDPCHLGRGQGLSDVLRSVLRSVDGVSVVEMARPDRCCGFGGVMRAGHKALSARIGAAKAEDIAKTGAEAVVTGCPGCRMQIADSIWRAGLDIPVLHTVQVVAGALREREGRTAGGQGDAEEKDDEAVAGIGLLHR